MISKASTHLNRYSPFLWGVTGRGSNIQVIPVPSDPSLTIWYDVLSSQVNNTSVPVTDGTFITSWADKSATAHDANTTGNTANKPKYQLNIQNGKAAIYFDGVNDTFTVNPITQLQSVSGYTYFVVCKTNSIAKQQTLSVMKGSGAGDIQELFLQFGSTGVVTVGAAGATATSLTTNTNFHIHTLVFDGSQTGNANRLKHRVDGVQQTLTFTGTVGATANAGTTYFYMGTDTANNNDFDGYVTEVIVYTKTLTQSDIIGTETYLKNIWGIV